MTRKHKRLRPSEGRRPAPEPQLSETMRVLTPRERAFVICFVTQAAPRQNRAQAARDAGYKDGPSIYAQAWRLMSDPRIKAAIIEESRNRLLASAPKAIEALEAIAFDPTHKKQLEALLSVLNRGGLHDIRQTEVTHKHELSNIEKWQNLIRGKIELGQDPRPLIANLTPIERVKVLEGIDVEFEEVPNDEA